MSKISLCMIVGNVEEYICRCLDSFKPIADEIIVVRAIGSAKPDKTLDICRDKYGAKTAEYHNAEAHKDWPHVDSFAAARQMSFDMATGDYCFWCDSDDVLLSGAARIRELAERGQYACFIFPYDIFGKNVKVSRERMMLKSAGKWAFPVHECFKFFVEPVTAAEDQTVIVQHLPHITKTGSNDRNLRILESIPPAEMNPGLKYHLVGELAGAGRDDESVKLAVDLITGTELGKDERYDLLMSLVVKSQDLKQRVDLLHEAHKVDPERREALGVLACTMMDMNRPAASLAYARQMIATTGPEVHCWNSRLNFYGYVGDDIYQQALRVNDRLEDAELIRKNALKKAGGPTIALVHATRGRPELASQCRKNWHDLAEHPERIEHIFVIDNDDKESAPLQRFHHAIIPKGGGCVAAWNYGAVATEAPVIVQLSDDWVPCPKWDTLILERLGDLTKPKVLAVSDGFRTDALLCMAICTRSYLYLDNFLFHPQFTGVYSDNWFTEVAYKRGAVIEARDISFQHRHFLATGKQPDKTYAEQNAPQRYAEGEMVYRHLQTGNDWSSIPGWFNYWGLYEYMACTLKDGDTVCEIGTWLGRSIVYLAQSLKRKGKKVKLIAVDTFKGDPGVDEHSQVVQKMGGSIKDAFLANIKRCGVDDMITVIEGSSVEAAKQIPDDSLAFCYIDAAHDYESVKRDIAAWRGKVTPNGLLAGHDAQWEEVRRAVSEAFPQPQFIGPIWLAK